MTAETESTAIWWIKRDLRLHDNQALCAAVESHTSIIPVFVFEPELINQPDYSAMHVHAWHQAVTDIRNRLKAMGSDVYVATGSVENIFSELYETVAINAIYSHEETGNDWTFKRDLMVSRWCRERSITLHEHPQTGVIRRMTNRDQRQTVVKQRLIDQEVFEPPVSVPLPEAISKLCESQPIPNHTDFYDADSYRLTQFDQLQQVSETQACADLRSFLYERGVGYSGGISSPNSAFQSGSRLSVHLAWGTTSLRTVFKATAKAQEYHRDQNTETAKQWGKSLRSFTSRLHWHDHFIQRLESVPAMEFGAINPAYEEIKYTDAPEILHAWTYGKTGFPLIDACMRCLQSIGFLNFRMRSMVVSFAVYGLHLSWRTIHAPLARIFLDYEPGIHLSQLQMQAGVVGINTIRVYNPTKQILDQDPDCRFIKHWVPELAEFSSDDILNYETMALGSYPAPIIDFKAESKKMKDQVFAIRKSAAGKAASQEVLEQHGSRKKVIPRKARKKKIQASLF